MQRPPATCLSDLASDHARLFENRYWQDRPCPHLIDTEAAAAELGRRRV